MLWTAAHEVADVEYDGYHVEHQGQGDHDLDCQEPC